MRASRRLSLATLTRAPWSSGDAVERGEQREALRPGRHVDGEAHAVVAEPQVAPGPAEQLERSERRRDGRAPEQRPDLARRVRPRRVGHEELVLAQPPAPEQREVRLVAVDRERRVVDRSHRRAPRPFAQGVEPVDDDARRPRVRGHGTAGRATEAHGAVAGPAREVVGLEALLVHDARAEPPAPAVEVVPRVQGVRAAGELLHEVHGTVEVVDRVRDAAHAPARERLQAEGPWRRCSRSAPCRRASARTGRGPRWGCSTPRRDRGATTSARPRGPRSGRRRAASCRGR
ncbi:MAG: hypothetical protein KatS3mg009_2154 [Acidimicrobiia bacterium]|nr:MAG: hypothetical protein KatS3mg009_2154 [Acidimicrobiia bacterium]